jgi:O-antigen/teichoic acid export membrane protein
MVTTGLIVAVAFLEPWIHSGKGFSLFFEWYWLSALVLLPFDFGLWKLQAEGRFRQLLVLRMINLGGFLIFVSLGWFYQWSSNELIVGHIMSSAVASVWALFFSSTGLKYLRFFDLKTVKKLWNFGRFSMGTFLGTALLKTADTVLIGWFLGSSAVAVYALAAKVLEALEVPLRAAAAVALPQLSAYANLGKRDQFRVYFYCYSGWLALAFLPLVLLLFYAAPLLLVLIGGQQYGQESVQVFRVLCLFGLLLPLDRMMGIALDAIGKPSLNMLKVTLMTLVNMLGDLLVLQQNMGLAWVAVVTLVNIALGVALGYLQLNRILHLDIRIWLRVTLDSMYKFRRPWRWFATDSRSF